MGATVPSNLEAQWTCSSQDGYTYFIFTVEEAQDREDWADFSVIGRYQTKEPYPSIKGVEVAWQIEIDAFGNIIDNQGQSFENPNDALSSPLKEFMIALNDGLILDEYFHGPIKNLYQLF